MTRKDFIDFAFTNDISFRYNGQEYYIFQGNNSCICGMYGEDKDTVFNQYDDVVKNIEDMLDNWKVDGKCLNELLSALEFQGN
ncbi:hypothetical protein LIR51_26805 [Blautia producta]|uniref:hypothetical protein n=1 Tax=Blautia TaxID=572511 RepID=UPI001D04CFAC|nr:hypothetical protein [Blautia producta]MCB5878422.1 hypothetical protein [Blautia producta]